MSMLDRYKKGNGLLDLVKLIEDSAEPKRSQLMNMVKAEDPEFYARVAARVLSWDKIRSLPEGIFAEIVGATPPKFIAMVLITESDAFVMTVEKSLGKAYNEYKQEKENFKGAPPTPSQVEAARRKMMSEARKLDSAGTIKIPIDGVEAPSAAAPAASAQAAPAGGAASQQQAPVSSVLYGSSTAAAKAEDPCPPLDSFKFELPPPGLSGERLATYLKSVMGF